MNEWIDLFRGRDEKQNMFPCPGCLEQQYRKVLVKTVIAPIHPNWDFIQVVTSVEGTSTPVFKNRNL